MYMKSNEISYLRVAKVVDTIADEYFLCIGYFSHLRLKIQHDLHTYFDIRYNHVKINLNLHKTCLLEQNIVRS